MLLRVRADKTPIGATATASDPSTDAANWKVKGNGATGKKGKPLHTHRLLFEEAGEWTAQADVLALQWLNSNVRLRSITNTIFTDHF